MNSNTPAPLDTPSKPEKIVLRRPRTYIPHLGSCIAGTFVAIILIGILMPVVSTPCIRGPQTKAFAQAKQIGLALRLFAEDHDGQYPRQGVPLEMQASPANSNQAFACLFPTYVTSENIFANKLSAYQTRPPDNVIDSPYTGKPSKTLEPGENVYGYVMGLTDKDSPGFPLVVDGTDGTGHYVTDPKKRGGVWKGSKAIVIHLDNSGALETLVGPGHARFIQRAPGDPTHNLLDAAHLKDNHSCLLDPAVATRP